MKPSEIRNMNLEEMEQKLKDATEEIFNLRFQNETNQLDNTARLKQLRRDIARLNTIITERRGESQT